MGNHGGSGCRRHRCRRGWHHERRRPLTIKNSLIASESGLGRQWWQRRQRSLWRRGQPAESGPTAGQRSGGNWRCRRRGWRRLWAAVFSTRPAQGHADQRRSSSGNRAQGGQRRIGGVAVTSALAGPAAMTTPGWASAGAGTGGTGGSGGRAASAEGGGLYNLGEVDALWGGQRVSVQFATGGAGGLGAPADNGVGGHGGVGS